MTNNSSASSTLTKDQQEASLGLLTFSAGGSQSSSFSKEFMEDQQKFLNIEPQNERENPQEAENSTVDNDEAEGNDGSKPEEAEESS